MRAHRDDLNAKKWETPNGACSIDVAPPGSLLCSEMVVPSEPAVAVARPRLHSMLDESAHTPVTLVAAPAGWGKTVLLSSWIRSHPDQDVIAWLSTEPEDDSRRFSSYLRACLGRDQPHAHHGGLTRPTVLVLDDFQYVQDAGSLDLVESLVRHAAERLRLIILTRADPSLPILRWRLSGDLLDLGPEDLAFTAAETAQLLRAHGLELSDDVAAELRAYVEGWPALLRLAALSVSGRCGSVSAEGLLAAAAPSIHDYVLREVYADQSPDSQDALLRTSIVERLSGGLIEAMTQRHDGESMFAQLQRRHMFAAPLGTQPTSHRYHQVLGDTLRNELWRSAPGEIAHLHRRAAHWHEKNGLSADALRHALAAGDSHHAVRLITDHWHEFVLCRRDNGRKVTTPAEDLLRADPTLAVAWAAVHLDLSDSGEVAHHLRIADRAHLTAAGTHQHEFIAARAVVELGWANITGSLDRVNSAVQRLLSVVGDEDLGLLPWDGVRAVTMTSVGVSQLSHGELDMAEESLADALALSERMGLSCSRAMSASGLSFIRAVRGDLRAAERIARMALAVPLCPGQSARVHCPFAYLALAIANVEWDRLEEADASLRQAALLCDPTRDPALTAIISVVRAQVQHESGDSGRAYETLLAGRRHLADRPSPFLRDWYTAVEIGVRAAHGDIGAVRRTLERALESGGTQPAVVAIALARAYLADDDWISACRVLPRRTDARGAFALVVRLEADLIEAVAAFRRGDTRSASRLLEGVLEAAEPDGFRRPFVRTGPAVRDLLVKHVDSGTAYWCTVSELIDSVDGGAARGPTTGGLTEPLTDRELTVLRYLQSILSNGEIACDMSVSVNTVKTHVRNIYRKLDSTGRREAVRRARELRLI